MSSAPVNADSFMEFVKTLAGQEITTLKQRKPFTVSVNVEGMTFTPSSGTPRLHQRRYVEKVLEQFNRTHSYITTEYNTNGIVNASYQLALIRRYLNQPAP